MIAEFAPRSFRASRGRTRGAVLALTVDGDMLAEIPSPRYSNPAVFRRQERDAQPKSGIVPIALELTFQASYTRGWVIADCRSPAGQRVGIDRLGPPLLQPLPNAGRGQQRVLFKLDFGQSIRDFNYGVR